MHEQTALSQLLDQVTAILELRKKLPPVPGENFNVFSVMHMETKEVDTHCRLLYELLSPSGSHGMGDCFLESFFRQVLQKPYPGDAAVSVYREYGIDPGDNNYGRIDLLLQGKGFCYPIEVKVYAGDQWEQVKRYARFSSGAQDSQVYYLTLDGHAPSEDSMGGIEISDVACLSFAGDIRGWLKRCGELAWNVPSVAEIIRQYIKLLDKLTGNVEGDLFMEQVKKTIAASRANFESALEISRVIDAVKVDTMINVFRGIKEHMGDRLELIRPDYEEAAGKYYQHKVYPGLSYRLATCGEYTLALRFEVGYCLYWGVALFQGNRQVQWPGDLGRFKGAFSDQAWGAFMEKAKAADSWWLWWKYLPNVEAEETDRDKLLNFKQCTGLYTQLYDPAQYDAIMSAIFRQIDQNIETIRKKGLMEGMGS